VLIAFSPVSGLATLADRFNIDSPVECFSLIAQLLRRRWSALKTTDLSAVTFHALQSIQSRIDSAKVIGHQRNEFVDNDRQCRPSST
jgi:hypothetical protein